MMLPPIYQKELFGKNRKPYFRGYKIFMGLLPDGIQEHKDFSMITIQDNCRCDYGFSIEVPRGNLSLFHINPIWAFAELKEMNVVDTILPLGKENEWTEVKKNISIEEEIKTFDIGFEKNKFQLNQLPSSLLKFLKKNKSQIKSIKIEAFSSVEGPTSRNLFLQKKRSEEIEKAIKSNLQKFQKRVKKIGVYFLLKLLIQNGKVGKINLKVK